MITRPSTSQADRDLLADIGLVEADDRVGTGEHAQHDEELVAS